MRMQEAVVKQIAVAALAFGVVLVPMSLGQSASDPDVSGTWVDSSNPSSKITFQEKGDKIQVHETDRDKTVADYTCNLSGEQCQTKEDGHSANVMIYYNGSKLIEITERGNDVTKRRFSLSKDGNSMTMEVIPISSEGKTITRTYQKQDSQVANRS